MSTFTVRLYEAIELTGGTWSIVNGVTKVENAQIGLDAYPLFDPTYRDTLNGKIIDHYWNCEIGQETIDMFQWAMRRRMNEIMPAYNQLYLSTKIAFDPLSTIKMSTVSTSDTTQNATTDGTANSTTDTKSTSRSVSSETPQTMLSGDGDYATAAADANSDSLGTGDTTEHNESTADANVNSTTDISGYQGLASDLIMRYRESIVNIDLMVIRDLQQCFMLIWDNADEYSESRYI